MSENTHLAIFRNLIKTDRRSILIKIFQGELVKIKEFSMTLQETHQEQTMDWDILNDRLVQLTQTGEARQAFRDVERDVQAETDAFRKRTIINHDELQKPFTI